MVHRLDLPHLSPAHYRFEHYRRETTWVLLLVDPRTVGQVLHHAVCILQAFIYGVAYTILGLIRTIIGSFIHAPTHNLGSPLEL